MAIDETNRKRWRLHWARSKSNSGKGSIMRLGEDRTMDVEPSPPARFLWISRWSAGGLPMGRIVEIYGPESSGKNHPTLQVIAAAQREGKTCAFIDAEHALDPVYARKLGVDIDNLLCPQPDNRRAGAGGSVTRWRALVRLIYRRRLRRGVDVEAKSKAKSATLHMSGAYDEPGEVSWRVT